jgi:hypothetical protein
MRISRFVSEKKVDLADNDLNPGQPKQQFRLQLPLRSQPQRVFKVCCSI